MKSNIATLGFLLLVLFAYIFCSGSCSGVSPVADPFKYANRDFNAEIQGNIDGVDIKALLQSRPSAVGGEASICLRYTSPESLEGLTLTRFHDGREEARLGELKVDNYNLKGLIEPFEVYFGNFTVSSQRCGDNGEIYVSICDENCDLKYVFAHGTEYPCKVSGTYKGRNIDLSVTDFKFSE
ncbi:MAG: hypothetical protein ACI3X1_02645 [Eubacteriales bacterium]